MNVKIHGSQSSEMIKMVKFWKTIQDIGNSCHFCREYVPIDFTFDVHLLDRLNCCVEDIWNI